MPFVFARYFIVKVLNDKRFTDGFVRELNGCSGFAPSGHVEKFAAVCCSSVSRIQRGKHRKTVHVSAGGHR